jgi:hypothetical protein
MTLDAVRVNLGRTEHTLGITYVALSRVRRLDDLLIDYENFNSSSRLLSIKLPDYVARFDEITDRLEADTLELIDRLEAQDLLIPPSLGF